MIISNILKVSLKPPSPTANLARSDIGIKSLKDLEGKRILVINLRGVDWAYTREVIVRTGGDPSKVHFLEINFPQMVDALIGAQADAASTTEPFTTIGLSTGKQSSLSYMFVEVQPGFNITGWSGRAGWVKEHSQAIVVFRRVLQKAIDPLVCITLDKCTTKTQRGRSPETARHLQAARHD